MIGKIIKFGFAILSAATVLSGAARGDVKIKSRQTSGGQTYENTIYIKGKRERTERDLGAMKTVDVMQCDLKRSLQIAPQAKTYLVNVWDDGSAAENTTTAAGTKTVQTIARKGGVITMISTIKDTGERKKMFGYTARHLLVTLDMKSSPDACSQTNSRMETDGWYIDAEFALDCENERYRNYRAPATGSGGCQDRYESKQIGAGKKGYPVYEKTVMSDDGKTIGEFITEVVELSNTTLDAALFDVPAGYREIKNASELYASMSGGGALNKMNDDADESATANNASDASFGQNVKNMANQNAAAESLGEKKPGVTRIGVAQVATGAVGESINAADLSRAIQNGLSEKLKSPQIEIVRLAADAPQTAASEAAAKSCDFVIYATAAHKKGGGGFGGMFGKALGQAVAQNGGGSWGNTTANVAGAIVASATVAALSQNVKAKDELTLDVKLVSAANGNASFAKQFKAKAKSNGEDIISPLVEQAANEIANAAKR